MLVSCPGSAHAVLGAVCQCLRQPQKKNCSRRAASPPLLTHRNRVRRRGLPLPWRNSHLSSCQSMIAYAAVRNLCAAAVRPLWLDEISTLIIVHQHRVSVMLDALKRVPDGLPPTFCLLQWPVASALRNEQVSLRLLSIIGFSVTVACLFLLIRKRNGSTTALVCTRPEQFGTGGREDYRKTVIRCAYWASRTSTAGYSW
jgi:hypothetical protein